MQAGRNNQLNPNPITKFLVVGLLGATILNSINHYSEWAVILGLAVMYYINGYKKDSVRTVVVFALLFWFPSFAAVEKLPMFVKFSLALPYILRIFYLPFSAGKFLLKTSDVGSIISSLDYLRIPASISIPIAVIFRFFPSFIEERNNIKMAIKIRGIGSKNPFKYLEYVAIPLLIISANIADEIAKAAETKCIANPIKKTRYIAVRIGAIDFIFGGFVAAVVVGGWLC